MSDKSNHPQLYRISSHAHNSLDYTVLGTPVPVSHSTVSERPKKRTFLVPYNADLLLSAVNENIVKNEEKQIRKQPGSTLDTSSTSILKIDSIQDSPAPAGVLSIEEAEAEELAIKIDKAELHRLEDAFSDLDCVTPEPDDYTLPTRACATVTHDAMAVSSGAVAEGANTRNDSATTVSSLLSTGGNSEPIDNQTPSQLSQAELESQQQTPISDRQTMDCVNVMKERNSTEVELSSLATISERNMSTDSVLPASSTGPAAFERSKRLSQRTELPSLLEAANEHSLSKTAITTWLSDVSSDSPVPIMGTVGSSNPLTNKSSLTQTNGSLKVPESEKRTVNPLTAVETKNARDLGDDGELLNQSSVQISRLHMSDVDGLLDMLQQRVQRQVVAAEPNAIPVQVDKHVVARQRISRFQSKGTLSNNALQSESRRMDGGFKSNGIAARFTAPLPTVDENRPPSLHTQPHETVEHQDGYSMGPPGAPIPYQHSRRFTSQTVLKERQQFTSEEPEIINSRRSHGMESAKYAQTTHKASATPSPLLSNTNCIVFCGAVCGQAQHQQMLLKHQLDRPITIRLLVSPGDDVFKLADERGYLLTGPRTVCLPPGLAYTVHVAYAARHPTAWDTGCLQLSIDGPERSTWKVRLIGYSNSCQLECSCCTQLSSDCYWTTAYPLQKPASHVAERQSLDMDTRQRVSGLVKTEQCLTSVVLTNFGARAAWVIGLVDPSMDDVNPSSGSGITGSTSPIAQAGDVTIEPSYMIVGPKQSANVVITLRQSVKTARIQFFFGDEVLRHQVRRSSSALNESSQGGASSHRQRNRRRIKVEDLMLDFGNETPFQLAEIPTQLAQPVRRGDWQQALTDQLRKRQHLTLNVYTDVTDSEHQEPNHVSPPVVASSILVGEMNQSVEPGGIGINTDCSSTRNDSELPLKAIQSPSLPLREVDLVQLDPPEMLIFPISSDKQKITHAQFRLSLKPNAPVSTWQLLCTLRSISNAQPHRRSSLASCANSNGSPSSTNAHPDIGEDIVFRFTGSHSSRSQSNRVQLFGTLSNTHSPSEAHSAGMHLPFEFQPPPSDDGESRLYRQQWRLTVWIQSEGGDTRGLMTAEQTRSYFDIKAPGTVKQSFTLTLEGQSQKNNPRGSPSSSVPVSLPSPSSGLVSIQSSTTRGHSRHKLGPLHIDGQIPVIFEPLDLSSSEEQLMRSLQLELVNRMKENTIFVQIGLPSSPFHVLKPEQTQFRILPNRRVHLMIGFKPTEVGSAKSNLRLTATALPVAEMTGLRGSDPRLLKPHSANVTLFGVMR